MHKVHLPQGLSPRPNWDPPTPSPPSEYVPLYLPGTGGGGGGGGCPNSFIRLEKNSSTLSTPCIDVYRRWAGTAHAYFNVPYVLCSELV